MQHPDYQNPMKSDRGSKSTLSEPLITSSLRTQSELTSNSQITQRVYANNAPKILLETLTARTGAIIIGFTYLAFIIGFLIDIETIFQSSHLTILPSLSCPSNYSFKGNSACLNESSWIGMVTGLENVISIQLSVEINNFSLPEYCLQDQLSISFFVNLQACGERDGCFSNGNWEKVLSSSNINIITLPSFTVEIFPSTFQNQQSLPTQGIVQSYLISVDYSDDPCNLFLNNTHLSHINYYFSSNQRSNSNLLTKNVITVLLILTTLIIFIGYIYIIEINARKTGGVWLVEQIWIVCYFFVVILYQNPVALYVNFSPTPVGSSISYTAYLLDNLSQASFFVIWLAFADNINFYSTSPLMFYGPKLTIGLFIFVISVIILKFQFPSLSFFGGSRNPYLAVADWTKDTQLSFCVFSIIYETSLWFWLCYWFWNLISSHRLLNSIPYMTTRYLQLSHRYFMVQAFIVTFYYMFEYGAILYGITSSDSSSDTSLTDLTDNINSLSRAQSQLFGKMFFLTTYSWLLAFLFLPASFMGDQDPLWATFLTSTFVVSEDELATEIKTRSILLQKIDQNIVVNRLRLGQLLNTKIFVFCVDLAIKLRTVSFQAYCDPPTIKTKSGYEGSLSLSQSGLVLIDFYYDEEYENICFICRESSFAERIVVVFRFIIHFFTDCFYVLIRGTASRRQMEINLDYKLVEFDIFSQNMDQLNPQDGLECGYCGPNNLADWLEDQKRFAEGDLRGGEESLIAAFNVEPSDNNISTPTNERTFTQTLYKGAGKIEMGVFYLANGVFDATQAVVDATTGAVVSAAEATPGLKSIVKPFVHRGFWTSYLKFRLFLHSTLRREIFENPADILFTGHSLGGALSTLAAMDFSVHSLPRLNHFLSQNQIQNSSLKTLSTLSLESARLPSRFKAIHVSMYNFGSPRIGNISFSSLYDKIVPDSFRVVVDGDLVAGVPPSGYKHVGTTVLIDAMGAGSIIIDPSFVERWLCTQAKRSLSAHSLLVYRKSLLGVKYASEFISSNKMTNANLEILKQAFDVKKVVEQKYSLEEKQQSRPSQVYNNPGDSLQSTEGLNVLKFSTHTVDSIDLLASSFHTKEDLDEVSVENQAENHTKHLELFYSELSNNNTRNDESFKFTKMISNVWKPTTARK